MPYILAPKVIMHSFSWFLETCPLLKESHKPSNCLYPCPNILFLLDPWLHYREPTSGPSWEPKSPISVSSLEGDHACWRGSPSYVSLTLSLLPSPCLNTHQQSHLLSCSASCLGLLNSILHGVAAIVPNMQIWPHYQNFFKVSWVLSNR